MQRSELAHAEWPWARCYGNGFLFTMPLPNETQAYLQAIELLSTLNLNSLPNQSVYQFIEMDHGLCVFPLMFWHYVL